MAVTRDLCGPMCAQFSGLPVILLYILVRTACAQSHDQGALYFAAHLVLTVTKQP